MVVTVFCLTISLLAVSGLALQGSRAIEEQSAQVSAAAADSGNAVAAQQIASLSAGLCKAPFQAPASYQPGPDGKSGFRWWIDKRNIAAGNVKVVVESNSGNPTFPSPITQSSTYGWNSTQKRWEVTGRKGTDVSPYPVTDDYFPVSNPARFSATPANRGMGTNLSSAKVPDLADAPPAVNEAIVSDGRYVWLSGDFTSVTGSNGTFDRRYGLVKFDTLTGQVESWNPTLDSETASVRGMLLSGDDVVIAGTFTKVNGTNRARIAKVNKETGDLNATFNAAGGGATDDINDIAYDSGRNLIVAVGSFSGWTGAPGGAGVGRFPVPVLRGVLKVGDAVAGHDGAERRHQPAGPAGDVLR